MTYLELMDACRDAGVVCFRVTVTTWRGLSPEDDNKPEWTLWSMQSPMITGRSADEILTRLRAHLAAQNIPASAAGDVGAVDPPTPKETP
jgi:hypothetical protein